MQVRGQILQSGHPCCLDHCAQQFGCIKSNVHASSCRGQQMLQDSAPWDLSKSGQRGSKRLHARRRMLMRGADLRVVLPL